MSAREKLFEAMAGGWSLTQAESAGLRQVIDDALAVHAHELAEEVRRDALLIEDEGDCCRKYGLALARSIDPQKSAGPVRPTASEEQTA